MEFSTSEIAKAAGIESSKCSTRLKAEGCVPVRYDTLHYNQAVWNFDKIEDAINILKKRSNKSTISFFTICRKYGYDELELAETLRDKGIKPVNVTNGIYQYNLKDITDNFEAVVNENECITDNNKHPLVTEKKCLIT